ncbi:MAG: stage II sporulation protein P [Lachnospiraceae bacterium]|nr:stage II sporulation protein P [Lachnospiraceae bacterium]
MRRRHYRYRKRQVIGSPERRLALCTFFCIFILLSFCYKEEFCNMVFSQTYFGNGALGKTDISLSEMAFSLVGGKYGFYLKYPSYMEVQSRSNLDDTAKEYFMEQFGNETSDSEGIEEDALSLTDGKQNEIEGGENSLSENTDETINPVPSMEELMLAENQKAANSAFIKQEEPVFTPDYDALQDFSYLKQHYYTVDSTTSVTADKLDVGQFLTFDATMKQDSSLPQILIYHTHSQEGFVDSVAGDPSTTIVGVGEKLAGILREEYGFHVIHDTGIYDLPNRDYAYSVSAPAIEKILAENPSIEVVIDLHRDGVSGTTHLVQEVGGRQTAQFMFFNGISYLNATGDIDYLKNPYIKENLAFSFQMKLAADRYYPGFARNIYLKGLRYNMHYRPKSLLIEVGAQTNTVQEAMNAAEPLAQILAMVLKGEG